MSRLSFVNFSGKVILTLLITMVCQAQTNCRAQNVNKDKNENQETGKQKTTVVEKKTEDDIEKKVCDFSSYNTLDEKPGAIVSLPYPSYPKQAKKKNIVGDVSLRLLMNREGKVEQVCVLTGDEILAESAMKSAKLIKVAPSAVQRRLNATNRSYVEFTITYTFK